MIIISFSWGDAESQSIKEQLIGEYLIKLPVGSEAKVSWSLSTMWANAAWPFLKEALNTQPQPCLTRIRTYSNPQHTNTHSVHTPPRRVPQQQLRAELKRSQREVKRDNNQSDHRPGRSLCLRLLPVRREDTHCYTVQISHVLYCGCQVYLYSTFHRLTVLQDNYNKCVIINSALCF